MSHPVTRSKRKLKKKRHKAKMRKLASKRKRREEAKAATAQREPLGSQIMQDENAVPAQEAAVEQEAPITEAPLDGEIVEAEEETTEHVEAESTTETTTEVQAEPGTSVIPASASAEEDDSL